MTSVNGRAAASSPLYWAGFQPRLCLYPIHENLKHKWSPSESLTQANTLNGCDFCALDEDKLLHSHGPNIMREQSGTIFLQHLSVPQPMLLPGFKSTEYILHVAINSHSAV